MLNWGSGTRGGGAEMEHHIKDSDIIKDNIQNSITMINAFVQVLFCEMN